MTSLTDIQKEARKVLRREMEKNPEYFLDLPKRAFADMNSLIALAYAAGKEAAVGYIEKEITKRGTYDLNYDDIYEEARNAE